jgi:hypothetical protein
VKGQAATHRHPMKQFGNTRDPKTSCMRSMNPMYRDKNFMKSTYTFNLYTFKQSK